MRYWLIFLIALLVLVAAAALAPALSTDPGYVLIQLGEWQIETTVIVIAIAILLIFVLIRLLLWIVDTPRRAMNNLSRRRMEKGLLALAEGNWSQAEKALQSSASSSGLKSIGYLAAARAASSQTDDIEAEVRQQKYLLAADNGEARTQFLLELSRARMHIARNNFQQAIPILTQLRKRRRKNPQVLKLLAQCYRELGQWPALREILPAMRKAKIIDRTDEHDIQLLAATNELETSTNSEQLQKTWESLAKALRSETVVVASYAERTLNFDLPRLAETALISSLDKEIDEHLLNLYFQCQLDNTDSSLDKTLAQAEKWRRKQPDSAAVERLLGQICIQQKLWGKAKAHLLESIRLQPQQQTFQILGELLERHGEIESALHCFHNALQLSQGKPITYPDVDSQRQLGRRENDVQQLPADNSTPDGLEQLRKLGRESEPAAISNDNPLDAEAIGDLVAVPKEFHHTDKPDGQ